VTSIGPSGFAPQGSADGRRVRRLLLVWAFDNLRRRDVLVVAEETWHEVA
jgi:hypothetical protein